MLTSNHVIISDPLSIETVCGMHLAVPTHCRLLEQLDQQLGLKASLQLIILLTGGGQQVEHILNIGDENKTFTQTLTWAVLMLSSMNVLHRSDKSSQMLSNPSNDLSKK